MIYTSGIIESILQFLFVFIITTAFSIFSPFGIGFVIFSIVRGNTKAEGLKKASFVIQVILTSLAFLIGLIISLLFVIRGSPLYSYSSSWVLFFGVLMGICFVSIIEIAVIIWQSHTAVEKFSRR
jgi:uncharacterized membrane protein YbhN (UPF0104 family)